ncbi:MAG: hypothetical protein IT373_11205, partial [Polyangiaceae bacterium]|nr:hypothetical protein [Polyangiaceae bacterium]
ARLAPEPLCRALVYTLSLSRYLDVAPVAEIVDEESTDDAVEPRPPDAAADATARGARALRPRSATPRDLPPASPAARGERAVYPTESPWQAQGRGHVGDPARRPPERPSQSADPHARATERYSQTGERTVRPSERAPDERPSRSSERPGPTGERSQRPSERPSQASEVASGLPERPSQSEDAPRDTRPSEERIIRSADRSSQSDAPAPPSSDRAARPSVGEATAEPAGEPSSDGAAATPKRQVAKIKLRRMAVRRAPPAPTAGAGPGARPVLPPPAFEEVATRVAQLEEEGPFDLLDLDPDALANRSETEVADLLLAAYEECSRRWDPRHYPEDLAEMRVAVSRVHRAMRDAFLELSDPTRRAEAVARLAPPSSGGEAEDEVSSSRPRPILSDGDGGEHPSAPPALYARALAVFQSGRFADALRLCEQACTGDPENPDYAAMAAWLRAHQPDADLAVVALDLDDVLHAYEDHVPARYYRALVRDRLGERGEARRDLERILLLEPNHADAKRKLAEWRDLGSTNPSRRR